MKINRHSVSAEEIHTACFSGNDAAVVTCICTIQTFDKIITMATFLEAYNKPPAHPPQQVDLICAL